MVRIALSAFVLAAALHAGDSPKPVRIALYVAIDEYHADNTIRDLHGCENDMRRLATTLSDGYGFRPYRFIKNKDATRDGIKRGLWWLMDQVEAAHKAGAKDIVVVFGYAGHGGLLRSRDDDEKMDTTIVPSDGGRRYRHHIRDDDVNRALGRIQADFGATVVYIRDSCHSGTAYRAAAFAGTRSVRAAGEKPASSTEGSLFDGKDGRPELANRANERIVYLGAVSDRSLAEEGLDPSGEPCGKFSWSLARVLARGREGTTYAELYGQLLTQFRKDWPESRLTPPATISPSLKDMKCFGSRRAPPHAHVIARRGKEVELSQGMLHGVAVGSVFRFYKDLTNLEDGVREVAKATVTDVADVTCTAQIEGDVHAAAVGRLDRVQFADFKVGLLTPLPAHYERIRKRLNMPIAKAGYAIALAHRGDSVFAYLPNRLDEDSYLFQATSPAILEDILARYAAVRHLLLLERNDGAIKVSFRPSKGQEKKEMVPKDGVRQFQNGAPIDVVIKNTRPHAISVFAFYYERSLTSSYKSEFDVLWPKGPGYPYRLKPGETLVLRPPEREYFQWGTTFEGGARFTVKLLVTEREYDSAAFSHLAMRTGVRGDLDELQQLLNPRGGGKRGPGAALRTWWGTASLVFEVAR